MALPIAPSNKMNMLWYSNSPSAPTGYGNQTALLTPLIKMAGYGITIFSFYGIEGKPIINKDGILELPRHKDLYGRDLLKAHYEAVKADFMLSLIDPFILEPEHTNGLKWAVIVPLDSVPIKYHNRRNIARADWRIAMSRFGVAQMEAAGFKDVLYVPHATDTKNHYKPVDRDEARERLGKAWKRNLKDKFLIIDNSANKGVPSRKNFAGNLTAFQHFAKDRPDALYYIHTDASGAYGEDLNLLIMQMGLQNKVIFPDTYQYVSGWFNENYLNDVYNAGDVFLHLAMGEGFGIPILEAQAAGCPVIVTDATAMSELCFDGWKIPGFPTNMGHVGSFQFLASQKHALDALNEAYGEHIAGTLQKRREASREKALEYDIEVVFKNHMLPTLEKIENDIKEEKKRRDVVRIGKRKPRPALSVTMPCYNARTTIDRAINSIVEGNAAVDYEIIIVDDCSDDGTWKHLRTWRKNERITVIKNHEGGGPVGALNEAIKYASGKYIVKLDADDWFEPNSLQAFIDALDTYEDVGFVYGQMRIHGQQNRIYTPNAFNPDEFKKGFPAAGEIMYRREAHSIHKLKNVGFWNKESRWFGPHDRDFVMQLIFKLGWKGYALRDQLLLNYNMNDDGIHNQSEKADKREIIRIKYDERWHGIGARL